MPFGTDAVLLGDLALEEVDLRTIRCQRGKTVRVQDRSAHAQQSTAAVAEDGVEVHRAGRGWNITEQGRDPLPIGRCVHDGPAKVGEGQLRDLRSWDRLPGGQRRKTVLVHCFTSRKAAASRKSDSRGGGT